MFLGSGALVKGKGKRKLAGQVALSRFWARSPALAGAHGANVTVLLDERRSVPTNRIWCSGAPQAWLAVASVAEPGLGQSLSRDL